MHMSKQKYYAVKEGNNTGIFDNWMECFYAIKDYSKPSFSAFLTLEDAKAYMLDPEAKVFSENDRARGKVPKKKV